jgi:hypothetical protein
LGYTPVVQEIFGTEPGDLRQVLRDKVDACEGLIQSARGFVVRPPGGVGLVRAKRSGYPQKLLAQVLGGQSGTMPSRFSRLLPHARRKVDPAQQAQASGRCDTIFYVKLLFFWAKKICRPGFRGPQGRATNRAEAQNQF